eukprot:450549-Ditylum_brightwellii.AAC.1
MLEVLDFGGGVIACGGGLVGVGSVGGGEITLRGASLGLFAGCDCCAGAVCNVLAIDICTGTI